MGSKTFLFLGLFLTIFLMISSEVVARELAESFNSVKPDNVNVEGYGKRKKCYKCCKKYKYGCKYYCCSYEEYVAMGKVTESQPQN